MSSISPFSQASFIFQNAITSPSHKENTRSSKDNSKKIKKHEKAASDLANYLNDKYLTLKEIALKAKIHAEEAQKRQTMKTNHALQRVSLAQNKDFPLSTKKIGAIRRREYTKAIIEQINAEHANILASKIESLAHHLSKAAKKAKKVAHSIDFNTDINNFK